MMIFAQTMYKTTFAHLEKSHIKHPETSQKQFSKVSWDIINRQYHYCHQMIGADPEGNGGQRCLFSNLLAVLVAHKDQLTVDNVLKLRRAMATYLDKLANAEALWAIENRKPAHLQSKDAPRLKELAELLKAFKDAIKNTHNCQVTAYQAWLRDDKFYAANIDISNLSPFEIQLCAYTIGVRIGLLPINLPCKATVDDCGRVVEPEQFYGPNTKEFLLMGAIDPDGKGGSYYGLFPKLNLTTKNLPPDAFSDMSELEDYWKSIDVNHLKQ